MTIDLKSTYDTIESLQHNEDYDEIRQIVEFATAALVNDGESVKNDIES